MAILLAAGVDLVEPGAQATTVSLVFGSALIVSSIAPAVAGRLADTYGIEAAFALGAGIVLTTAFLSAVTQWRPRTHRRRSRAGQRLIIARVVGEAHPHLDDLAVCPADRDSQ